MIKFNRVAGIAAAAVGGATIIAGAGAAGAATFAPPSSHSLPATLSASGTGASATWNGADSVKLTVGSPSSTTFAQADIKGVPTFLPTHEPSFTTTAYAAGSPRFVMELANGTNVVVYPAQFGAGANAELQPKPASASAEYVTWATALSEVAALPGSHVVKDVFIVADGDQAAGTTDNVDNVLYNGHTIVPAKVSPGAGYTVQAHGHVMSEQAHRYLGIVDGKVVLSSLGNSSLFAMVKSNTTGLTGLEVLNARGQATGKFVSVPGSGNVTVVNGFAATTKRGSFYNNAGGAFMNNAQYSSALGNRQIGWPVKSANEEYTTPGQ